MTSTCKKKLITKKDNRLSVMELTISSKRICFLKFILEGYDGLALLSTRDAQNGMVEIRYPESSRDEVLMLIDSLYPDLV